MESKIHKGSHYNQEIKTTSAQNRNNNDSWICGYSLFLAFADFIFGNDIYMPYATVMAAAAAYYNTTYSLLSCILQDQKHRNSKYSDSSNLPPHSHLSHARTQDQRHARQRTEKPLASPQAVSVSIPPVWTHSSKCQCGQHSMSWESQSEFPFMWENSQVYRTYHFKSDCNNSSATRMKCVCVCTYTFTMCSVLISKVLSSKWNRAPFLNSVNFTWLRTPETHPHLWRTPAQSF